MKKYLKSIPAILLLGVIAVSCSKEDKLDPNSYLPTGEIEKSNAVDQFIHTKFIQPFNIAIDYRWDRNNYGPGLDNKRNLYPSKLVNVQPALEMVDKVWIQSYLEVAGKEFVQRIRPGRFLIAGGYALNDDGTRTLGLASGGVQVTLYEVDFLQTKIESARQFIHTIQHEYIHIINQDRGFNESEFGANNLGYYTPTWYLLDPALKNNKFTIDTYANVLGFVTGYSRSNIIEDFAETASFMLTQKPAAYQAMLAKIRSYDNMTSAQRAAIGLNDEFYRPGGADKIERKVALVRSYFKKNFGIDFDELARVANKNADESPMLNNSAVGARSVFGIQSELPGIDANKEIVRYCQGYADSKITLNN